MRFYPIKRVILITGVIVSLTLNSFHLKGQTLSGERIDCILPNAEGVALIKAIERMPSIAFGIPDISIPLMKVPGTEFQLKLSYNPSGLHVDELPTVAGLGWRLETGGLITRVVMGLPDDYTTGYLNRTSSIDAFCSKQLTQYTSSDISQITSLTPSNYDDSPDIFYYDVFGVKGKFVLSRNGEVVCFPRNNLKITYEKNTDNSLKRFIVKFPNGNEAFFSFIETNVISGYAPFYKIFSSSWKLSYLKNESQNILVYNYGSPNYYNETRKAEDRLLMSSSGSATYSTASYTSQFTTYILLSINSFTSSINFDYKVKSSVGFASVISGYAWYYLDKIRTINQTEPEVQFFFNNLISSTPQRSEFLLSSIKKVAAGITLPYTFGYYSGTIPNPGDRGRDLWGYYNGIITNTYLVPSVYNINSKLSVLPVSGLTPIKTLYNRTSSIGNAGAGTLSSITSPAGLRTEYHYDLNSFIFGGYQVQGGGLRVKSIKNYDNTTLVDQTDYLYLTEGTYGTNTGVLIYHPTVAIGLSTSNTPLTTSNWNGNNTYIKSPFHGSGGVPFAQPVYYTKVVLSKSGTGSTSYTFGLPIDRGNAAILPTDLNWSLSSTNQVMLTSGVNKWIMTNDSDPATPTVFSYWTQPLILSVTDKTISGTTVKSITYSYKPLELYRIGNGLRHLATSTFGSPVTSRILHSTKLYYVGAWRELYSQLITEYHINSGSTGINQSIKYSYARPDNNSSIHFNFLKRKQLADALGVSTISRYKYSFEPELAGSGTISNETYELIQNCINSCDAVPGIPQPDLPDISSCVDWCYDSYTTGITPDIKAIELMNKRGEYSNPIEEITIVEKPGVKKVINGQFWIYNLNENEMILPLKSYRLASNVDSSSFIGLGLSSTSPYSLIFDANYKLVGEVTGYNAKGKAIEYLNEDKTFTATLWDADGQYPLVTAENCRYNSISGYVRGETNEETLRNNNPSARITTREFLFPYGIICETNPLNRNTYTIYNSLGEVAGIKDHDKNLRKLNIAFQKLQTGSASIITSTDPDNDAYLANEVVYPNLNLNVSQQWDYTLPLPVYCTTVPIYNYTVDFGDGTILPYTYGMSHKYSTTGSKNVKITCKRNNTFLAESTATTTLVRYNLQQSYEFGFYLTDTSPWSTEGTPPAVARYLSITARPIKGNGQYTVTWNTQYKTCEYCTPSPSSYSENISIGNTSTLSFNVAGYYTVTCSVTDGTETVSNTWSFIISESSNPEEQ